MGLISDAAISIRRAHSRENRPYRHLVCPQVLVDRATSPPDTECSPVGSHVHCVRAKYGPGTGMVLIAASLFTTHTTGASVVMLSCHTDLRRQST